MCVVIRCGASSGGLRAQAERAMRCRKRANAAKWFVCLDTPSHHKTPNPNTPSDQPGIIIIMSSGGKAPGGKSGGGGGGGGGKKGKLKDDLVRIVYGYGDAKEPVQVRV